jgi:hypothetical protein
MAIKRIFIPDHEQWEGVRPINVYALRVFYLLMAVFVAPWAWKTLLTHAGPWDPTRAVAICAWAVYPSLGVLGLIHPLRMLPIMLFTIGYKSLWFIFVAWPLYRSGTLAGTPAGQMAADFALLPLLIIAVPWTYVYRRYVRWPSRREAATTAGLTATVASRGGGDPA